ncbi:MAG: RNA-binding protein hfq [Gloeocapsa sp. DLM2.Bin57]|nr:MAG: RNA-binding protein hfq [Gloeocapsa sp. DLM2.Bin57]
MSEFDITLPSIRQVQTLISDKQEVEVKLVTDDLLVGTILWQDHDCICLVDQYEQKTLIWRQALVYLKLKS